MDIYYDPVQDLLVDPKLLSAEFYGKAIVTMRGGGSYKDRWLALDSLKSFVILMGFEEESSWLIDHTYNCFIIAITQKDELKYGESKKMRAVLCFYPMFQK